MNGIAFFLRHPVIALVLNAAWILVGVLSLRTIEVRDYPQVEQAVLTVSAYYPQAGAGLVESAVLRPLEKGLSSLEQLQSMTGEVSGSAATISLKFRQGYSAEAAMNRAEEAVQRARSDLPQNIKDLKVERETAQRHFFFLASLTSPKHTVSELEHYAEEFLRTQFLSLEGVASVQIWAEPEVVSVDLDPHALWTAGLGADEVLSAMRQTNQAWPLGLYQDKTALEWDARFTHLDALKRLVISNGQQRPLYLETIANVHFKLDSNAFKGLVDGQPAVTLAVYENKSANLLNLYQSLEQRLRDLQGKLPPGMQLERLLNRGVSLSESFQKLKSIFAEAIVLVSLIVYGVLKNGRWAFIPVVAIPLSLSGGIWLLYLAGYSLNIISLLAFILAVGLVVDDAIVVIENVFRKQQTQGASSPREAVLEATQEISFAIVAMTVTLISVYMPLSFLQGALGRILGEFALALSGSVFVSGIVSLTLTPWMCERLYQERTSIQKAPVRLRLPTRLWPHLRKPRFWRVPHLRGSRRLWFDAGLVVLLWGGLYSLYQSLPKASEPEQDQNIIGYFATKPDGVSLEWFEERLVAVGQDFKSQLPFKAQSMNFFWRDGGNGFFVLPGLEAREQSSTFWKTKLEAQTEKVPSLNVWAWNWFTGLPGIESSSTDGDRIQFTIKTTASYEALSNWLDQKLKPALKEEGFRSMHVGLDLDTPVLTLAMDERLVRELGVAPSAIADTIAVGFSKDPYGYFYGRQDQTPIHVSLSPSKHRLDELYVKNRSGQLLPLSVLGSLEPLYRPRQLLHQDRLRASTVSVERQKGLHFGENLERIQKGIRSVLDAGFDFQWAGDARQFFENQSEFSGLMALSLCFIFLILSVQFNHFVLPWFVLMSAPLGWIGGLLGLKCWGLSLTIYGQIGLMTLIGLMAKQAILLIEFARTMGIQKAVAFRKRPIWMTTAAMALGALPLIWSRGSGFEARREIGVVLVFGLLIGTGLTLWALPRWFRYWEERKGSAIE